MIKIVTEVIRTGIGHCAIFLLLVIIVFLLKICRATVCNGGTYFGTITMLSFKYCPDYSLVSGALWVSFCVSLFLK